MEDWIEWIIVIGGAALMFIFSHFSYEAHKRYLMWAAGLAGIGLMIWLKGAEYMWTWLLALGWLGVLVWLDRRLQMPAPPEETPSDTASDDSASDGRVGSRRY
ncbi:MAG: hypothetical protein ACRCTI_08890 [Beijerinckiaceae bacterium]